MYEMFAHLSVFTAVTLSVNQRTQQLKFIDFT